MILLKIIHIFLDIYIILLVLRMFISQRDAYFNPIYQTVYRATDPVVIPLRRVIGLREKDVDLTPLIPIVAILVLDGFLFGLITRLPILSAVLLRVRVFIDYAFLIYVLLILTFSVFYQYARFPSNAIIRAGFKMLEPLYVGIGRAFPQAREWAGLTSFILLALLHALLVSGIELLIRSGGAELETISNPFWLGTIKYSLGLMLKLTTFFTVTILIGVLLSWVSPDPNNPLVQLIYLFSDPLLRPFRRILPLIGGIDFTPILAISALQIIRYYGRMILVAM